MGSLTALVIGSMTPDFEYFIRMRVASSYSHNWQGLFWYDLPLSILLMIIYNKLVKDKLIDDLPAYFNKRLSMFKNSEAQVKHSLLVIILSLPIGIATHILWDGFTHPAGYFVNHIHKLKHRIYVDHHPIQFYNILQHLSSLLGALVILYSIAQLPAGKDTRSKNLFYYWLKIIAVMLLVLAVRFATGLSLKQYGDVIVTGISGGLTGLIVVSAFTKPKQIQAN